MASGAYTHTHTHTYIPASKGFQARCAPPCGRRAPGLKISANSDFRQQALQVKNCSTNDKEQN